MRLYLIVGLIEVGMLASVLTVSHLKAGSLEEPVSLRASLSAHALPPPEAAPSPEAPRSNRRRTREARLKQAREDEARAAEARAKADMKTKLEAKAKAVAKQMAMPPPPRIYFSAMPQSPATERRASPEMQAAELDPNLQAAIFRMEGMFDPTRVAFFGPSLRMAIRPGTAEMVGISGNQWRRVSYDPNAHTRTTYMALAWYQPIARDCADFWLFRPNDTAVALDQMAPPDCRTLRVKRAYDPADPQLVPVVAAPLSLPAFLAPHAGNRLTRDGVIALRRMQIAAIKDALFFKRRALFGTRKSRPMVAARVVVRVRGN